MYVCVLGIDYVIPKTGFYCKLCSLFYTNEEVAKLMISLQQPSSLSEIKGKAESKRGEFFCETNKSRKFMDQYPSVDPARFILITFFIDGP